MHVNFIYITQSHYLISHYFTPYTLHSILYALPKFLYLLNGQACRFGYLPYGQNSHRLELARFDIYICKGNNFL